MREFFKSLRFKILIGLLALFLGFILYEASTGGYSSVPSSVMGTISAPFQWVASKISNFTNDTFGKYIHAGDYETENQALKEELAKLRDQMVDYEETLTLNKQLSDIVGVKELNPDFELEPASVVGRDPNDSFGAFTINRGSLHGVKKDDPVITAEGLVGKVTLVGPTYSHVTTILSPSLTVGTYDIRTKDSGTITGDIALSLDGMCKMQHLKRETSMANGFLVATAGSSGIFPANLVIGTVQEVQIESNGVSAYAVIKPSVDINAINNVFVIKAFLGQGDSIQSADPAADKGSE